VTVTNVFLFFPFTSHEGGKSLFVDLDRTRLRSVRIAISELANLTPLFNLQQSGEHLMSCGNQPLLTQLFARISVNPATIQMRVFVGNLIIAGNTPERCIMPARRSPRCSTVPSCTALCIMKVRQICIFGGADETPRQSRPREKHMRTG
jgi:hypothetical protein